MRYYVTFPDGREVPVEVTHLPTGEVTVTIDGKRLEVDALDVGGGVTSVRVGGRVVDLWIEGRPPQVGVVASGARFFAKVENEHMRATGSRASKLDGGGLVCSPMPGRVLKLLVEEGDAVNAGSPLVVVEAMKMENELAAERSGRVVKVFVTAGENVESGTKLVEIG